MQSLTAIVVFTSLLSNLQSFKQNPHEYQNNLYTQFNNGVAQMLEVESYSEESNEYLALTEPVGKVLGDQKIVDKSEDDEAKIMDSNTITTTVSVLPATDEVSPTPTSTPVPTSTPIPTSTMTFDNSDVVGAVERAANEFGVDMDLMKRIASCESGFNASAHNTAYDYAGLYQFHPQTWSTTRTRMGEDTNPALRFSAQEAARTAAFKISHDGPGAWGGCL